MGIWTEAIFPLILNFWSFSPFSSKSEHVCNVQYSLTIRPHSGKQAKGGVIDRLSRLSALRRLWSRGSRLGSALDQRAESGVRLGSGSSRISEAGAAKISTPAPALWLEKSRVPWVLEHAREVSKRTEFLPTFSHFDSIYVKFIKIKWNLG